jgi:hypothetical protein
MTCFRLRLAAFAKSTHLSDDNRACSRFGQELKTLEVV